MAGTAAKIVISEKRQKLLEEFSKSRTIGQGAAQRAIIILSRSTGFTLIFDLNDKQREFMEYYNRMMAQPFAWAYTGRPVQKKASRGHRASASAH